VEVILVPIEGDVLGFAFENGVVGACSQR
jgi:hypothetical protein